MQARIGAMECARLHVQLHAISCHSFAVNELRLPDASHYWHYELCQVACAKSMQHHITVCCE